MAAPLVTDPVPVPPEVQTAIDVLRAIYEANPASMSDSQTATAVRNVVIVLRWLNRRIEG